jgi:hypothetical protein
MGRREGGEEEGGSRRKGGLTGVVPLSDLAWVGVVCSAEKRSVRGKLSE